MEPRVKNPGTKDIQHNVVKASLNVLFKNIVLSSECVHFIYYK